MVDIDYRISHYRTLLSRHVRVIRAVTPFTRSVLVSDEEEPKRLQPKWLLNDNHDKARRSRKQEDRVAKKIGGSRIPRSGGLQWSRYETKNATTADGDLSNADFHVEHKRTDKKSISIKKEWLDKVRAGAHKNCKDPALIITFEVPNKPSVAPEDWICIPLETAIRMLGYNDEE